MTTLEKIRTEIQEKYDKYEYLFDIDYLGTQDLAWILSVIDKYAEQEPTSPCDLCAFNPASSADGKPCCMCPAEMAEKRSEA